MSVLVREVHKIKAILLVSTIACSSSYIIYETIKLLN